MMLSNEYVEIRNGGYYLAGTRIGVDIVVYAFRNGEAAEDIFDAYPSIGSLAKVYGAITFILEHPADIDAYLKDQDRLQEKFKTQNPMPPDTVERFERVKKERSANLV